VSVRFTIVVPTYDRPQLMRRCLGALAALDYPRAAFEVVVVDDGSAAPLALDDVAGVALRVLRTANGGPGAARNAGAAAARGEYLVFTDDDCRPAPSWLARIDAALERAPDDMIGGRTVNALAANRWAATSQAIVDMAYDFYNADAAAPRFFASNNMAVPAGRFAALGGFHHDVFRVASEDRELCDRWHHAGYGLTYVPDAVVAHAHDLGFRSFCRQHFRYGRGAMRYHRVRARRRSGLLRQDMPFHLQLPRLLRRATHAMTTGETAQVAWRLVLWQLCNAAGYFYEHGRAFVRPDARVPSV
jgi:GT2 family glycosyltransferase